jgi:hypothetical protein
MKDEGLSFGRLQNSLIVDAYTILGFRFWIVDCHAGQHNT